MSTAFSIAGSLDYPPDDGQPIVKRPFSRSGNFNSKMEADLVLAGAGTQSVGFGTITQLKAALIEVDPTSLAPVILHINGGTDPIEIAPGGFWAYSNPAPATPITSMDVVYTMDARVQVRLLG